MPPDEVLTAIQMLKDGYVNRVIADVTGLKIHIISAINIGDKYSYLTGASRKHPIRPGPPTKTAFIGGWNATTKECLEINGDCRLCSMLRLKLETWQPETCEVRALTPLILKKYGKPK